MKCVNCGDELISGSLFCANCGARIVAPTDLSDNRQAPKNKGPIIALIALLVVVIAGGAVYSMASFLKRIQADENPDSGISKKATAETVESGKTDTTGETDATDAAGETGEAGETEENAQNSESNRPIISDANIIGLWSSEGPSGEMVDPGTGYATGSIYNGSWYLFNEDGTFRHVIVGSGPIISGGVVSEGKYLVGNGKIILTDVRESWYPDPAVKGQTAAYEDKSVDDSVLDYRYDEQDDTLVINDLDFYHRVKA